MTPQQIDAMKLALEALEVDAYVYNGEKSWKAITALKEALAEHAMRNVQRLGQEIEEEPVVYQCPRCATSMQVDLTAKAALAQMEQEPVACRPRLERVKGNDFEEWRKNISPELYAAGDAVLCWVNEGDLCMPPPQRKPLLASEIVTMYAECPTSDNDMIEFARAIEAAHDIEEKT